MRKILFFMFALMPVSVLAVDDCPFGEVDCAYPGECGAYVDTDTNEICDHSQESLEIKKATTIKTNIEEAIDYGEIISGKELKTKTVTEVADLYEISAMTFAKELSAYLGVTIKTSDNFQLMHDNYGMEPSVAKDIAAEIKIAGSGEKVIASENDEKANERKKYPLILTVIITLIGYFATHSLFKAGKITRLTHRRIWNSILTFSFAVSALLGILLVLRINFGTIIPLPFNVLYWHVVLGIVMSIITIFHIAWHWAYFKTMFKRPK